MAWRRISWHACKGGAGLCLSLLDLLLAFSAAGLVIVIASIHLLGTVAIPGFVIDLMRERFAREELAVEWRSARFDLTGGLIVEGLSCRELATAHPIFTAEAVQVDFDLTDLVRGKPFSIEHLFLRDADLFLPPELASDAGEAASLHVAEFRGRVRGETLEAREILVRSGALAVCLDGEVPFGSGAEATPPAADRTLADTWRAISRRLGPALAELQALPALQGRVRSRLDPEGNWLAAASLTLPTWEGPGFALTELVVTVPEVNLRSRSIDLPIEVSARALALPVSPRATLNHVSGWIRGAPLVHATGWRFPGQASLYGQLTYPGLPALPLAAKAALRPLPTRLQGTLRLVPPRARLDLAFDADLSDRAGSLRFTWEGDPDPLLAAPLLADLGLAEEVRFSDRTRLRGDLALDGPGTAPRGSFEVLAFGAGVREAAFDEAHASGWFNAHHLQVGPILAFDPGEQWAEGYYLQSFDTQDYRIVAEGAIFPRRLDSLLPSFYRELWEDIDPGTETVRADVDVLSRWGGPDATTALVHARGRNLAYLGLPVAELDLHLWQATGFVDILHLRTRGGTGHLEGSIGLTFPPKGRPDTPRLRLLDLDAQLGLDALAVVFGEEVSEVGQWISFRTAPQVEIAGIVSLQADGSNQKDLTVNVRTDDPWTLLGVPFDRLSAALALEGPRIRFDPFVAGVGEGRWELVGHLQRPQSEAAGGVDFQLETVLERLPYETLWQFMHHFAAAEPEPGAEEKSLAPEATGEPRPGTVDLSLAARAQGELWSTLEGSGSFAIEDAPLGKIHLLGGLSRAFSAGGLNLTTLQLDQAQSTLQFAAGRLEMPDLEVRSPTVRIEIPGSITFPEQALDFNAKVFFLDTETVTPLVLLETVLRPLGYVFELKVEGVLGDPEWRLLHNPFNLFRPRDRETEEPAPPREPPAAAAEDFPPTAPKPAPEAG